MWRVHVSEIRGNLQSSLGEYLTMMVRRVRGGGWWRSTAGGGGGRARGRGTWLARVLVAVARAVACE
jgi:hypothetical protein